MPAPEQGALLLRDRRLAAGLLRGPRKPRQDRGRVGATDPRPARRARTAHAHALALGLQGLLPGKLQPEHLDLQPLMLHLRPQARDLRDPALGLCRRRAGGSWRDPFHQGLYLWGGGLWCCQRHLPHLVLRVLRDGLGRDPQEFGCQDLCSTRHGFERCLFQVRCPGLNLTHASCGWRRHNLSDQAVHPLRHGLWQQLYSVHVPAIRLL
mmetsp:Transcript_3899/g.11465  ORF Transcript_3899/g.11465 Transcript_3899/m.11465 type:complete len:209 (+) Transcript_3899:863-1489(+)